MEFSIRALAPEEAKTACLVLGVYKQGTAAPVLSSAAQAADRAAQERATALDASGHLVTRATALSRPSA